MKKSTVYFLPYTGHDTKEIARGARKLLDVMVTEEDISLEKNLPIKVHFGEPGNISYVKPENYSEIITFVKEKGCQPFYVETCTATGPRSNATSHKQVAKDHGFTQIPVHIADGENGFDQIEKPVVGGKYFKTAKIAKELAEAKQVLVLSHFKGHGMAGFGGAIKMVGIGFASARGKIEQHSKKSIPDTETINWSDWLSLYHGTTFRERTAEYAQAAVSGQKNIYITFAISMVKNCDCDGEEMKPLYEDVGIFASTDIVAIDAATMAVVKEKIGKKPFDGEEILPYAEKLGIGSSQYELITLS